MFKQSLFGNLLKIIFSLLIFIVLVSCVSATYTQLSQMNPQQLQHVSDTQLCDAIDDKHGEYQQKFIDEQKRRGIKSCGLGELYCTSLGINYGNEKYPECMMHFTQLVLELMKQQAISKQQAINEEQLMLQKKTTSASTIKTKCTAFTMAVTLPQLYT